MAGYDFNTHDQEEDRCSQCCYRCRRKPTGTERQVQLTEPDRKCCSAASCRNNIQLALLLAAVGAGVGLGLYLRTIHPFNDPEANARAVWYLDFPVRLTVRAMSLLAVPLLVSSIVSGITSLGNIGKVGLRTMAFYVGTTCLACVEGFAFVFAIRPGADVAMFSLAQNETRETLNKVDMILDVFRNLVPDNIVNAAFRLSFTKVTWDYSKMNTTTANISQGPLEVLSLEHKDSMNILGLTVLSFVFGITIKNLEDKAKPLADLFTAVFEVIMYLLIRFIWLLPIGIVFMIASTVVKMDNPVSYVYSMAWFLVSVIAGLATHFFLVMPFLLLVVARVNPLRHFARMGRALATALATNNSNITLPVTMECLQKGDSYDPRVVRFMCPIGATVNMDGTCLYEAMAVIFVAMLRGVSTGPSEILSAGLTAILVSIGVPTAGSGVVVMGIILESIGLPFEDGFLFIPLDWFLGRLRTAVNIWGDSIGVAVVCYCSRKELANSPLDVSEEDSISEGSVAMVMNGSYRPIDSVPLRRKSYTLTVENESGDVVKVSKV